MNIFVPPFCSHFCLSLNKKKTGGNESHEKVTAETQHYNASAADLLRIRIGNLNWCKCGHGKNEAREVDCLSFVQRWMQWLLLRLKSWSSRAPRHPGFLGNFPSVSQTC